MNTSINSTIQSSASTPRNALQSMEVAARSIEKSILVDNAVPSLWEQLNVNPQIGPSASGLTDADYATLGGYPFSLMNITQIKTHSKVPLPPEIKEHFSHLQCHCMMGLFPEIHRAWLTIDSDIYVWTYEEATDIAYYDGLNETILCVGLIRPKPGVFHTYIKHLLVLSTATEIVVLGVTFANSTNGPIEEIQLISDPVFTIPTDGAIISTFAGSKNGRLFFGTKDGSLYEISYQAESSWFGKRCKKINHSTSSLSFLVPSFINAALTEEDGIVQISIDDSRHILYLLTEKGAIEVYDMGENGNSMSRVARISQSSLVNKAVNAVKTLDSSNFRPITSISAVEVNESAHTNLVAVTQTGVRFYLSTSSITNIQPNQRPYTLALQHVRLPPGYSANITVRPRMAHISHYRDRNLILISTVDDKDILWCMSSDLFPFSSCLTEAYTTIPLDGPALAFAEITHTTSRNALQPLPPLLIRQHAEPPRKYVALTAQGAHIFLKLRPVDILRQLLLDGGGADGDSVKAYFNLQREEQACATSLILASLQDAMNKDVAEWATRAFFLYGGEPRLAQQMVDMSQSAPFGSTTVFAPNVISTPVAAQYKYPAPSQHLQNANMTAPQQFNTTNMDMSASQQFQIQRRSPNFEINSPFVYSPKHTGLYLHLSRILRPIWNLNCVQKVTVDSKKTYFTSTIAGDECVYILSHLTALKAFLFQNTQFAICNSSAVNNETSAVASQTLNETQHLLSGTRANFTLQDAQLEERESLSALKTFVTHCCEILGLWRILSEHQFHELVACLAETYQQMLQNTLFKDLLLFGHDLCAQLIAALINMYLGDNASVDSISSKLRTVCPSLYKTEDAAYSKATEVLKNARTVENINEREEYVASALQLCKSVAHNINLHEVCHEFTGLKAYTAVTDLCVSSAKKLDPDDLAVRYYKNQVPGQEVQGHQIYLKRMEIYKEILNMLEAVYNQTIATTSGNQESSLLLHQVVNNVLQYNDELLHAAVYDWMLSKQMKAELISIKKPSLEVYLVNTVKSKPDNTDVMELLWKYYESNNNHASAAKILSTLASTPRNGLTLRDRVSYLSRAVMCMRSENVGCAPQYGMFLRDLEDKVDIAKVQEKILRAIANFPPGYPHKEDAIEALNVDLYDITPLYEQFADRFGLWECKLAIMECAGYSDTRMAEKVWFEILQAECKRSGGSGNEKFVQVLMKVKELIPEYKSSKCCFPLPFIVNQLEQLAAKLGADNSLTPHVLVTAAIPFEELLRIYNQLTVMASGERFWLREEYQFHFAKSVAALINLFVDNHQSYSNVDKRKIISLCQDNVAGLLSDLYSKPNTEALVNCLKNLQISLNKL